MVFAFLGGMCGGMLIMMGVWGYFVGRHRRRKPTSSLTKYVAFSISVVIVYTVAEMIVSTMSGVSHDVLSGCVYGFFAGEVAITGLIKIFKLRAESREEQE